MAGKEFLLAYFPVSTADDECSNDLCTCTDDDGSSWEIQQGRVALDTLDFETEQQELMRCWRKQI